MEIPGFSQYTINEFGDVFDKVSGGAVTRHNGKYLWVYIYSDAKKKNVHANVHALMALAYKGPRPSGHVASFVDGNTQNLYVDNIVWADRRKLAAKSVVDRMPRQSTTNTADSRRLIYDTMSMLDGPTTMVALADMLEIPYSVVRYSMYHLMADGNVKAVKGGYIAILKK